MSLPVLSRLPGKKFQEIFNLLHGKSENHRGSDNVTDQILGNVDTRITPIATNPMQLFV